MKLDITISEPRKLSADSRAGPCPQAEDDDSAAKYLFELSHDAILFLDRTGKILCINPCGVQLSGYSAEELRGANIFELLLLPEDHSAVRQMLQDAVKGRARECEVRWKTNHGALCHFARDAVPSS